MKIKAPLLRVKPSEVEDSIAGLQMDEAEAKAMRAYYQTEKQPMHVSGKTIFWLAVGFAIGLGLCLIWVSNALSTIGL